ncbi:hypothetical protein D1BOALGB6SA_2182 [Olavius sp. associated proteobacterium Delta 1]|nr:hypothetical protein D1BOALGB6SA_2182 [Olavius sp. associated proteobacterium Delta 1]
MQFNFEWDPIKAKSNKEKPGITFEQSVSVFRDSRALTIYDSDHSGEEDRWLTLGISATGLMLIVHHTYNQINKDTANTRIISSRKATKRERSQYME